MTTTARRDVVWTTGPDAAKFLQGQVSQDVAGMAVGESRLTLLLQPTGKVESWGRITRAEEERFGFDVEEGFGAATLARLNRFRIRVKAELTLEEGVETEGSETAPGDDDELELARIRAGLPRLGAELDDTTIPAEAGQWIIDSSVDFTKGCYVGQELVARVDSRGSNTPRRLRHVDAPAGVELEAGAELTIDGAVVGTITSAVGNEALGYLKRTVDAPTEVQVATASGPVTASVREL